MTKYPKRLIEVDLPIKKISAHARREKSIRHGHISTLHIWWARRPLAACRAVICAALWLDPADPNCPIKFKTEAARLMKAFRDKRGGKSYDWNDGVELRKSLLEFIADFANWDNSTNKDFLETSRALTQVAHESLGGEPGTRPLVVDPFAGGGSIPLEALRVGADAFASDLNPVAVLLNKVVLEYIPKYGQNLADEVRKWGEWVKKEAEKELTEFYPKDPDGSVPIAYLWARTIKCEGPGCGAEVPLMRSLWLAKKESRSIALRIVVNKNVGANRCVRPGGEVVPSLVDAHSSEDRAGTRPAPTIDFEILEKAKAQDVQEGTVRRGSATCPVCVFTTPVTSVRAQLKTRRGGADDARLFAVVTTRPGQQGRFYRLPTEQDLRAVEKAKAELEKRANQHEGLLSLVPNEEICLNEIRRISVPLYGMTKWGDVFTSRQALSITTLARLVRNINTKIEQGLSIATKVCLALAVDKQADRDCSLCRWISQNENIGYTFGRQAIGMMWDFVEAPWLTSGGGWQGIIDDIVESILFHSVINLTGTVEFSSATKQLLPDDSANVFFSDPPYYDAVPYSHLSDFFYVWLRRMIDQNEFSGFSHTYVVKTEEIVVDRPHYLSTSTKDILFYEMELNKAFIESRRILKPDGIGSIVFASKTTASWEAILKAIIDAGWVITGSWPIDTEREARIAAQGQARLASSVHIVCRPREKHNPPQSPLDVRGEVKGGYEIGDWRDVLAELPKRIHEWMPRLAEEGVVGADAIFACLGPALEIFSRYSRVEKASGEIVPLKEYLEYVWAAVAKEALNMIFEGAETTGFEEDARLTAMWLWTLSTGTNGNGNGKENPPSSPFSKGGINQDPTLAKGGKGGFEEDNETEDDETDIEDSKTQHSKLSGYTLEYDAARKIAQGLGAHLEKLQSLVEVKGDKARLLPVAERTRALFGKDEATAPKAKKKKKEQMSMFAEIEEAEESGTWGADTLLSKGFRRVGNTTLDRLHQSMILFATGRGEALKRFLVEEGVGRDERFWRLAQAFSALYPKNTDEKRWVDGVLARKKGLGL